MSKCNEIIRRDDTDIVREQITELLQQGYKVRRPSPHHVKIGHINYFPTTGTITMDPCHRHTEKGYTELIRVLEIVFLNARPVRRIKE